MSLRMTCPTTDELRAVLDNTASAAEQDRLTRHLEGCPPCQKRLESLVAGRDSWSGAARRLADEEPAPGAALGRVMAELRRDSGPTTDGEAAAPAELPPGFLTPSAEPGHLGRLRDYEVTDVLSRTGMSVVLKAFDTALHRVVAIKVLAPQLAASAAARTRFLREARAAAAVCHEHVVPIYAVEESNGLPYLVMPFVPGRSVQEKIDRDGPLEVAEVVRIGLQTAEGLAAAHAQGLIHRDVKPANLLLEDGVERVKIADFGLARAADDASLTQSGVIAGTPQYMAPEQANGEAVDPRADLFSLGSVLYAMCTGRPPFRASTTLGVLRRVVEDHPRPVRDVNPDVPAWLATVIDRLHAKDPDDRYATAGEVADVLAHGLAHLQQPSRVLAPGAGRRGRRARAAAGGGPEPQRLLRPSSEGGHRAVLLARREATSRRLRQRCVGRLGYGRPSSGAALPQPSRRPHQRARLLAGRQMARVGVGGSGGEGVGRRLGGGEAIAAA